MALERDEPPALEQRLNGYLVGVFSSLHHLFIICESVCCFLRDIFTTHGARWEEQRGLQTVMVLSFFVTKENIFTLSNSHMTQQPCMCENTLLAAVYCLNLCIIKASCNRNNKWQSACGWKWSLRGQPPCSSRDPPGSGCTGLDGFCISSRMETLQPPGQPVPVFDHLHSKKHAFLRGKLFCFSLGSMALVLDITGDHLKGPWLHILFTLPSGTHRWDPPKRSLLQAEQSRLSQPFFIWRCSSSVFALVALCWILSSSSVSVFCWEAFKRS